ncbi:MAG: flavin-dependent dehydrogenase [Psychrobacter glaciei]|jgi:flavin-dependent dehydrogenase
MELNKIDSNEYFDVVICGGGLAGLTLGIQLKRMNTNISICILERQKSPLPDSAHKVGESTVVIGAYYLENILDLKGILNGSQLEKLGLRFFFDTGKGVPLHLKPELGRSKFKHIASEWQLDRGTFETQLRIVAINLGVKLLEGTNIKDIDIKESNNNNTVSFDMDNKVHLLNSRWIVDATGRRRLLQKNLGLEKESVSNNRSAAWFRIKGRIDFSQHVPSEHESWHKRVNGMHPKFKDYGRNNSTTHFVGDGYWAWVIPLASGNTSIGVVADNTDHPLQSYNTKIKIFEWLEKNEPELSKIINNHEVIDFSFRRDFSYSCKKIISSDHWAMTGESGVFIDPLYSPGTDSIGYSNSMISSVIIEDLFKEGCSEELLNSLSNEFIDWSDRTLSNVSNTYSLLGNAESASLKIIWDLTSSVWFNGIKFRNVIFEGDFINRTSEYRRILSSLSSELIKVEIMNEKVFSILLNWKLSGVQKAQIKWLDYFDDLTYLFDDLSRVINGSQDLEGDIRLGIKRLEDLALSIFLIVLKDFDPARSNSTKLKIETFGININSMNIEGLKSDFLGGDIFLKARNVDYILSPLNKAFYSPTNTRMNLKLKDEILDTA